MISLGVDAIFREDNDVLRAGVHAQPTTFTDDFFYFNSSLGGHVILLFVLDPPKLDNFGGI
jgi:hypothetical protein